MKAVFVDINQTLESLVQNPRETRDVEYKQSSSWNSLKHKIVKAALGMSNIRDGGYIIIGVEEENNQTLNPKGMNSKDSITFITDNIQEFINKYADPAIQIEILTFYVNFDSEKREFIGIRVKEFPEIPIICKKDFHQKENQILRRGAIYSRSFAKNETCEVKSQEEMREIIEIAVNKNTKTLLRRLNLFCPLISQIDQNFPEKIDQNEFDEQIKDLL